MLLFFLAEALHCFKSFSFYSGNSGQKRNVPDQNKLEIGILPRYIVIKFVRRGVDMVFDIRMWGKASCSKRDKKKIVPVIELLVRFSEKTRREGLLSI